jgi:hypothetical protein
MTRCTAAALNERGYMGGSAFDRTAAGPAKKLCRISCNYVAWLSV